MFKKHHVQVKFVKDAETPAAEPQKPVVDMDEASRYAKDFVKYAATTGVVIMGVSAIFSTLSKIAVIEAEARHNKKD